MTINLDVLKGKVFYGMLYLSLVWMFFALSVEFYFIYLEVAGKNEKLTQVTNEITWRIDGTFKNNPDNIWYEGKK